MSRGMEAPRGSRRSLSLRKLRTFESFKNPVFRIYFCALVGQWFGMSMQMITRSLLIYRITGSGAIIGLMAMALALPSLVFALFGGAIADRLQKKHILVAGLVGETLLTLIVAIALATGFIGIENPSSWWLLLVIAILQGVVMGFMAPASTAIIPEIVGEERVMNAISLSTFGGMVFQLVGPALAGFLIEAYGFTTVYIVMTVISVVAVGFAALLPHTSTVTKRVGTPLTDIIEGLRYIRRNTAILLIVIFGICHMISGLPYEQLLPIFTEDILKVGASGLGILMTVSAAGSLVAALVLASIPNRKRGILLIFSGLIMGLALIVFSWSSSWPLSLAIIPFAGVGPTLHWAMTATLVQYYVDPSYRGRMQSFVTMGSGLASFGTFIAGVLADAIGVQWSICGMAIFLTIVSVCYFIFARPLTKLD